MEEIFDAADKKKPETLSEKDIETIKESLPDVQEAWDTAKKARFSPELYGFSRNRSRR